MPATARVRRLFAALPATETRYLADLLRTERVGGALLLVAAAAALAWANSPFASTYDSFLGLTFGPARLHLELDVATWAADGLLAVFFFVAGLELKREFVEGELRDPARAALPVGAALCGVAVPAAVFLALTASTPQVWSGWAVPVATDIAFALAVLAVIGSHLPTALRSFLLTLAVVDDLIAIVIIAVAFTDHLALVPLGAALAPLALFAVLARRRAHGAWLVLPAVATWALVHASGVHATVAGVVLAFTVPVIARPGERHDPAERLEHALRPVSAGVAVPIFALTAAGVHVGADRLAQIASDPVTPAVVAALVLGKFVGVLGGTYLIARFTRAELDASLRWADVAGVAWLTGIGFTVSLLISDLAFGAGSEHAEHAKASVLAASLLAAALAAVVLRARDRHHRAIAASEALPDDADAAGDGAGESPAGGVPGRSGGAGAPATP